MPIVLTANEARIIGCLMEKSVVTPDQYPLTLNSLTNACNQKSSRDPIMSLEPGVVQRTLRDLEDKHFVRIDENFKSRAEKYVQRFCNTPFSELQFDEAQYAIVCLLLLRGPQTPGELRARSGRLYTFADNSNVVDALNGLAEREGDPLIIQLPRTPGRKDSEYMHLFFGDVDIAARAEQVASLDRTVTAVNATEPAGESGLTQRVNRLEEEVALLKAQLQKLQ